MALAVLIHWIVISPVWYSPNCQWFLGRLFDRVDRIKLISSVHPCVYTYVRPSVHKKFLWFQWKTRAQYLNLLGQIFYIRLSFCFTWLWSWHKLQLRGVDPQSPYGANFLSLICICDIYWNDLTDAAEVSKGASCKNNSCKAVRK